MVQTVMFKGTREKKVCANWLVGYRVMSPFYGVLKWLEKENCTVATRGLERSSLGIGIVQRREIFHEHGIYQTVFTGRISAQTNTCSKCFIILVFTCFHMCVSINYFENKLQKFISLQVSKQFVWSLICFVRLTHGYALVRFAVQIQARLLP